MRKSLMTPIEIIVIILSVCVVVGVFGRSIYKNIKKIPSSDCACCASKMKRAMNLAIKEINKDI